MTLAKGVQVTPVWPNFSPGQFPNLTNLNVVDQNSGRPARQTQWSIGVQREIFKDLLVEAAYVGNVGAWWPSTNLVSYNLLTPQLLAADGLNVTNAADRTLLSSQIGSSLAASRGFNKLPYPGFPLTGTVAQALRPFPQYGTLAAVWAPLGKTWYDSLQAKVTKRISHGLSLTGVFTWQKSLQLGTEAGAQNDVFNRSQNKYLSSFDQPFVLGIHANYTVPGLPKLGGNAMLSKAASWVTRDWTLGTVLQYASGIPILAPASTNALASVLFASTFANRVPGVPLFTQDLNCHCFDPNTNFVLNPAAWTQPAAGTYGTAAAYYGDYRYQRRPTENISLARRFVLIRERLNLTVRGEFTNMFNRTEVANPTSTNSAATQVRNAAGQTVSGFGYINPATPFGLSRQGMIIARFQF